MRRAQLTDTDKKLNNSDKNKWLDDELSRSALKDARLQKRFRNLLTQLWEGLGQTIPFTCQDWANTKAAYRFLSNDRIKEDQILTGHFQSTKVRVNARQEDCVLILQDTTEFTYYRGNQEAIGFTRIVPTIFGKLAPHKKCGILMHSSLAITVGGRDLLPLNFGLDNNLRERML